MCMMVCKPNIHRNYLIQYRKKCKNEAEEEEKIAPRNWKFEQRLRARTLITIWAESQFRQEQITQTNCFSLLLLLLFRSFFLLLFCFTVVDHHHHHHHHLLFLIYCTLCLQVSPYLCVWARFMEAVMPPSVDPLSPRTCVYCMLDESLLCILLCSLHIN